MPDILLAMLSISSVHVPSVIVLIVGVMLALQRRKVGQRHASMALAGFLFLLVSVLVFTPLGVLASWTAYEWTGSAQTVGIVGGVVRGFQSLVSAVGIALLIAAVFARQSSRQTAGSP